MHCSTNFRKGIFFIVIPVLLVAVSAVFFMACQKSNDNNLNNGDDQGGYASDASRLEWATDDVISIADAAGQVYNGTYMGGACTVGTDTTDNPHVLVIRFGNEDNLGSDNRLRSGTIIVTYSGEYTDPNQLHTITFDNYTINDNQLSGTITTTRIDTTILGNWYYRVAVNDTMTLYPNTSNTQITAWQGSLTRKWVAGYQESDRSKEIFSISGLTKLTRANSHAFNFNIATPLQVALNCNYVESGVVNVTGTLGTRILNYGAGGCDAAAQLNIGVHVYELTLTP